MHTNKVRIYCTISKGDNKYFTFKTPKKKDANDTFYL